MHVIHHKERAILFGFQTLCWFFVGKALTQILTWMTAMGVIPTMKICLMSWPPPDKVTTKVKGHSLIKLNVNRYSVSELNVKPNIYSAYFSEKDTKNQLLYDIFMRELSWGLWEPHLCTKFSFWTSLCFMVVITIYLTFYSSCNTGEGHCLAEVEGLSCLARHCKYSRL